MFRVIKTIIPALTVTLLVSIFLLPAITSAGQFKVVRVYDGDTLKAVGHGIEIKVRLVGINTPETAKKKRHPGQPYSRQATSYLARLVLNKTVEIKGYGLGRYNRILGVVFVDGKNANLEIVKAGLAEVYRGRSPKGFDLTPYCEAERGAKKTKKGIWSLGDRHGTQRRES